MTTTHKLPKTGVKMPELTSEPCPCCLKPKARRFNGILLECDSCSAASAWAYARGQARRIDPRYEHS